MYATTIIFLLWINSFVLLWRQRGRSHADGAVERQPATVLLATASWDSKPRLDQGSESITFESSRIKNPPHWPQNATNPKKEASNMLNKNGDDWAGLFGSFEGEETAAIPLKGVRVEGRKELVAPFSPKKLHRPNLDRHFNCAKCR